MFNPWYTPFHGVDIIVTPPGHDRTPPPGVARFVGAKVYMLQETYDAFLSAYGNTRRFK